MTKVENKEVSVLLIENKKRLKLIVKNLKMSKWINNGKLKYNLEDLNSLFKINDIIVLKVF